MAVSDVANDCGVSHRRYGDVARVLRFGIKDFLTKPITHLDHFTSAIKSTLEESQANPSVVRDFSSQWFQLDHSGQVDEEKELYWHLNHLKDNVVTSRDLLHALQPERDTQQGDGNAVIMFYNPQK